MWCLHHDCDIVRKFGKMKLHDKCIRKSCSFLADNPPDQDWLVNTKLKKHKKNKKLRGELRN